MEIYIFHRTVFLILLFKLLLNPHVHPYAIPLMSIRFYQTNFRLFKLLTALTQKLIVLKISNLFKYNFIVLVRF